MITGRQIRAARGLLRWSAAELAEKTGLTRETINKIEDDSVQPREGTIADIVRAFEDNNVEFIGNAGVQIRQDTVYSLQNLEGFKKFMDDVYVAACDASAADGSKPICISNVDDHLFIKHLGDYMLLHAQRMNDLKNVKVRILVGEEDSYQIPDAHYIEYRCNPRQSDGSVPFYVYGDKLAILKLDDEAPRIIVISSGMVAKAYRDQFETLWQISKNPAKSLKPEART